MNYSPKVTVEEIESLEQATFSGEITVISDSGKQFEEAIDYLNTQKIIGFDTETKPCFIPKVPRNKMAVLQLAGDEKAFLFRLQQVGVPQELANLLANSKIIKVGAAVHDDIKGLQSYRKFEPNSFVDMQKLAPQYGIEEKSVRKMAAIIIKKRVSKSQQLSNWESSQLSEAQQRYAAVDAWVCKEMYERLMEDNNG